MTQLTLEQARAIVARAVAKAQELGQRGAFVVVDDGGNVVSSSRMDGAGPTSFAVSRAKAYVAAVNREPSARFTQRLGKGHPGLFAAYQQLLGGKPFPGPGAIPIRDGGVVVGALSTGAGIGPTIKAPRVDPARFLADGQPANAEDLIVCHALGIPYEGQHGDDVARWIEAYGEAPPGVAPPAAELPPAALPAALAEAIRVADLALRRSAELGVAISVAVTDRHGDIVQLDRMDGAPPMALSLAEAKAVTAVNFRCASGEAGTRAAAVAALLDFVPLAVPGGLPIPGGGAIGISGHDDERDEELARYALANDEAATERSRP